MLSQFLIKHLIKNHTQTDVPEVRDRYGYLSGMVGIIANIFLFIVKLTTGLVINSIAFIGDALNNLTDAASSIVTILGFKLASKPADEEHPYGHGRSEYIAGLIVSFLVMLVGYELLKSSLDRIINPSPVNFSLPALAIVVLAMVIKGWMFVFNRFLARKIDSKALRATAYDSLSDMVATGVIGVSLIASLFTTLPFDGYVGLLVSGLILYSGFTLTKETISPLLGEMPEQELVEKITEKIMSFERVVGIHDLIVHTYGPGRYMVSIHVEIPVNEDIMELHEYIDQIERQVSRELGILLTIHMDPLNLDSQEIAEMQEELKTILKGFPEVCSFHDFRIVGKGEKENLLFDVVVNRGLTPEEEKDLRQRINDKVREKHPYYTCIITVDKNYILINEN